MRLRVKYDVVLKSGDHINGTTPVTFDKSVKKKDRLEGLKQIASQVMGVYTQCQTSGADGHIRLGDWQLDANSITALSLTPQRSSLLGWKEVK